VNAQERSSVSLCAEEQQRDGLVRNIERMILTKNESEKEEDTRYGPSENPQTKVVVRSIIRT
jgi:hypothetical protein